MYLVAIAWLYVAVMMAIAEATHSQGSILGAIITLLLYGVLPLSLVLYVMGTPMRRRQRLQQEQAQAQAQAQVQVQAQEENPVPAQKPPADSLKNP
jgi:mannose/fructose/N-acetylgalactosamine-specific phosphotransferase system component IID